MPLSSPQPPVEADSTCKEPVSSHMWTCTTRMKRTYIYAVQNSLRNKRCFSKNRGPVRTKKIRFKKLRTWAKPKEKQKTRLKRTEERLPLYNPIPELVESFPLRRTLNGKLKKQTPNHTRAKARLQAKEHIRRGQTQNYTESPACLKKMADFYKNKKVKRPTTTCAIGTQSERHLTLLGSACQAQEIGSGLLVIILVRASLGALAALVVVP